MFRFNMYVYVNVNRNKSESLEAVYRKVRTNTDPYNNIHKGYATKVTKPPTDRRTKSSFVGRQARD